MTFLFTPQILPFLSGSYFCNVELSVNMLAAGLSADQFFERVDYLISQMILHQSKAKIVCLGVLPFYGDFKMTNPRDKIVSSADEFRTILKNIVVSYNNPRVVYADPMKALSMHNLTSDFIHPSNFGMIEIAEYLKNFVK